jgi:hypothetical protein
MPRRQKLRRGWDASRPMARSRESGYSALRSAGRSWDFGLSVLGFLDRVPADLLAGGAVVATIATVGSESDRIPLETTSAVAARRDESLR